MACSMEDDSSASYWTLLLFALAGTQDRTILTDLSSPGDCRRPPLCKPCMVVLIRCVAVDPILPRRRTVLRTNHHQLRLLLLCAWEA